MFASENRHRAWRGETRRGAVDQHVGTRWPRGNQHVRPVRREGRRHRLLSVHALDFECDGGFLVALVADDRDLWAGRNRCFERCCAWRLEAFDVDRCPGGIDVEADPSWQLGHGQRERLIAFDADIDLPIDRVVPEKRSAHTVRAPTQQVRIAKLECQPVVHGERVGRWFDLEAHRLGREDEPQDPCDAGDADDGDDAPWCEPVRAVTPGGGRWFELNRFNPVVPDGVVLSHASSLSLSKAWSLKSDPFRAADIDRGHARG